LSVFRFAGRSAAPAPQPVERESQPAVGPQPVDESVDPAPRVPVPSIAQALRVGVGLAPVETLDVRSIVDGASADAPDITVPEVAPEPQPEPAPEVAPEPQPEPTPGELLGAAIEHAGVDAPVPTIGRSDISEIDHFAPMIDPARLTADLREAVMR
nr:hypothetical protein [Mycobacterium sp.]